MSLSFTFIFRLGFSSGSAGKESACNTWDLGLISGLGRSTGEGNGYPVLYSGLENSMDCIVHGVAKSQTWLSDFHMLVDSEEIKTRWKEYMEELYRKDPNELDYYDGVVSHPRASHSGVQSQVGLKKHCC